MSEQRSWGFSKSWMLGSGFKGRSQGGRYNSCHRDSMAVYGLPIVADLSMINTPADIYGRCPG